MGDLILVGANESGEEFDSEQAFNQILEQRRAQQKRNNAAVGAAAGAGAHAAAASNSREQSPPFAQTKSKKLRSKLWRLSLRL